MLLLILNSYIPKKGTVEAKRFYKNSLFFIDRGRLKKLDLLLMKVIARQKYFASINAPEVILRDFPKPEEMARLLDAQIGSAGRKRLLQGVDMYIVINSPGGFANTEGFILKIMEWVKLMKGRVTAYAYSEASSAAAEIFSMADVKYALRNTLLLYHKGKEVKTQRLINHEKTDEYKEIEKEMDEEMDKMETEAYIAGLDQFFYGHKPAFAGHSRLVHVVGALDERSSPVLVATTGICMLPNPGRNPTKKN